MVNRSKVEVLWTEVKKLRFWLSLLVLILLVILYFTINAWSTATANRLVSDVLANLIPVFLTAVVAYLFLRHAQELRAEQEMDELATRVSSKVGDSVSSLIQSRKQTRRLTSRGELPRLEELISEAKEEIWVSGVALDRVSTHTGLLNDRIRTGLRLRLLALDPQTGAVGGTSEYFGVEIEELRARLKASLVTLDSRLMKTEPSCVEMRVVHHRPTFGYFIVDPNLAEGYITVVAYFYKVQGTDIPPMSLLPKKTEPDLFNIYLSDFESQWDNAEKWEA